jgi:hypothetical protein
MTGPSDRMPVLSMPWWASPTGIILGFLLPMLLLISTADHSDFEGLTVRSVRFLTAPYIFLGVALLLTIATGAWIGGQIKLERREVSEFDTAPYERAAMIVGSIALGAYVYWFKDFLLNPLLLLRTFTGAYRPDRTNISITVGLTSLVNVAPVLFCIYSYVGVALRRKLRRGLHALFIALLGCTLFRVYAWSERLALVELVVPFALAIGFRLYRSPKRLYRVIANLGPYVALPFLVTYFGIAESVRSWTYAIYNQKMTFWEFVLGRFVSYYYTSLNNGAGVLATSPWPTYKFETTLEWLHKAPIVGPLFSAAVNFRYSEVERFLSTYGDEEFNNPSAIYSVVYDLGLPLSFAYFAVVGLMAGILCGAYRSHARAGILLYPMFFLSFLELFRYPYFGASRAFTWTLGVVLAFAVTQFAQHTKGAFVPVGITR